MQYLVTIPDTIKNKALRGLTEAGAVIQPVQRDSQMSGLAADLIAAFTSLVDCADRLADDVITKVPAEARGDAEAILRHEVLRQAIVQFSEGVMASEQKRRSGVSG